MPGVDFKFDVEKEDEETKVTRYLGGVGWSMCVCWVRMCAGDVCRGQGLECARAQDNGRSTVNDCLSNIMSI